MKVLPSSILIILAWIIVFATGYLISRSGKPYSTALLTIHKLIPVAFTVLAVINALKMYRSGALSHSTAVLLFAAAAFLILSIATGGIISAVSAPPRIVERLHSWGSWLTGISASAAMILMRL